jgi:hypothetical protein
VVCWLRIPFLLGDLGFNVESKLRQFVYVEQDKRGLVGDIAGLESLACRESILCECLCVCVCVCG